MTFISVVRSLHGTQTVTMKISHREKQVKWFNKARVTYTAIQKTIKFRDYQALQNE